MNILQSRHVRKRKNAVVYHVQEEEEEEEEEEEVLSLVEEFKPDKLNLAQTLAGMLSIAAIQTVNTLKKEKKYIERVVSYGIAANSSNQAKSYK